MRRLINQQPGRAGALMLSALPFILIVAAYLYYSNARLAENPGDKLLPAEATIAAISALAGVTLGVAIGVLPYLRHTLGPFVAALSLIPPLAILPILFIVVGL